MLREAERCPNCGTRPAEWDPAKGGHKDAYAATGRMCMGCFHLDAGHKQWDDKAGVHPVLIPRRGGTANGS